MIVLLLIIIKSRALCGSLTVKVYTSQRRGLQPLYVFIILSNKVSKIFLGLIFLGGVVVHSPK